MPVADKAPFGGALGGSHMEPYDLVVIGSGPAGRRAAVQAAKLGKSVLVVEGRRRVGGVSVHTGTIPSKTLRETVLNLSGWRERGFYGRSYRVKKDIDGSDLGTRLNKTLEHEVDVLEHQFQRNGVRTMSGFARFLDPQFLADQEIDDGGDADGAAELQRRAPQRGALLAQRASLSFSMLGMGGSIEGSAGERPMAWGTVLIGFLLLYGVGEIIYSVVLLALESGVLRDCKYKVYPLSPLDSVALRRAIRGCRPTRWCRPCWRWAGSPTRTIMKTRTASSR